MMVDGFWHATLIRSNRRSVNAPGTWRGPVSQRPQLECTHATTVATMLGGGRQPTRAVPDEILLHVFVHLTISIHPAAECIEKVTPSCHIARRPLVLYCIRGPICGSDTMKGGTMERMDFASASAAAMRAMVELEKTVKESSIERSLIHLVKMRVSQINGCAYCLDMHSAEATKDGEAPRRLHTLSAWRETPFFTARESAALQWAEALTCIASTPDLQAHFDVAKDQFNEQEIADLTLAIIAINGWNRIAIGFGKALPD
jgi:AhpD family alkylhydroperoxidase